MKLTVGMLEGFILGEARIAIRAVLIRRRARKTKQYMFLCIVFIERELQLIWRVDTKPIRSPARTTRHMATAAAPLIPFSRLDRPSICDTCMAQLVRG